MSEAQLSDLDFLRSLPDNPEEAFLLFEERMKKECIERDKYGNEDFNKDAYCDKIIAFCEEHDIDLKISDFEFENNPRLTERKINKLVTKKQLKFVNKQKSSLNNSYIL